MLSSSVHHLPLTDLSDSYLVSKVFLRSSSVTSVVRSETQMENSRALSWSPPPPADEDLDDVAWISWKRIGWKRNKEVSERRDKS